MNKFTMNGTHYTILEVPQDKMWEHKKEQRQEDGYFFGQTHFDTQEIWLSQEMTQEKKRRTLMHEVMHCYIKEYFTTQDIENYNEEVLCDLTANSHDIIEGIVANYFTDKEVRIIDLTKENIIGIDADGSAITKPVKENIDYEAKA